MVGMTPIRSSPCSGLPFGARHLGQFFGLAEDAHRLVRDPFAERGEADDAARALDQHHAEQRLELAEAGGQGRLGDEAGIGRFAEMPVLAQRDQILELLDGGEMDGHVIEFPID